MVSDLPIYLFSGSPDAAPILHLIAMQYQKVVGKLLGALMYLNCNRELRALYNLETVVSIDCQIELDS